MSKRKKVIRIMAMFLASSGIFLLVLASWFRILGVDKVGISFPNNKTAYIGFIVVGTIYLLSATGMYFVQRDKTALINDYDERNRMIQSISGLMGFGVQTLLLISSLSLLWFMGYMSIVPTLILSGICVISILTFIISNTYLMKRM